MEPTEALGSAEQALRLLVREVLGPEGLTRPGAPAGFGPDGTPTWGRGAPLGEPAGPDPVDDLGAKPLIDLITSNAETFRPVIDDLDLLLSFVGYIGKVRNTIADARPLYSHERALLEGISGEIRTTLAKYRMGRHDAQRHYATLESVIDNFGFAGFSSEAYADTAYYHTKPTLEVGDTITFDCRGWDGRGRAVEWFLHRQRGDEPVEWSPSCVGTNATLTWPVTEDDVGVKRVIVVFMRNSGRFHLHRNGPVAHDGARWFVYHVNPPEDA